MNVKKVRPYHTQPVAFVIQEEMKALKEIRDFSVANSINSAGMRSSAV